MATKELAKRPSAPLATTEAQFAAYSKDRDEFLSTPFAHNTALAKSGCTFSIVQRGERMAPPADESSDELRPCFVYRIILDAPGYSHVNENTGEKLSFKAGDVLLVSLTKSAIRQTDYDRIGDWLLQNEEGIAGVCLQQYPNSDPKRAPAVGFVHKSQWKSLEALVQERKASKGKS